MCFLTKCQEVMSKELFGCLREGIKDIYVTIADNCIIIVANCYQQGVYHLVLNPSRSSQIDNGVF